MERDQEPVEGLSDPSPKPRSHKRKTSPNRLNPSTTETTTQERGRRGRPDEPGTRNPQDQDIPREVMVDEDTGEISIPTPPKPKRQRKSGMTYNKSPKKTESPEASALFASVIIGAFAVSATRLGPHWAITEDEAMTIAIPATKLISKYLPAETMEKYSDPTALVIAIVVVMAPRIMLTATAGAPKKVDKVKKEVIEDGGKSGASRDDSGGNGEDDHRKPKRGPVNPAKASFAELRDLVTGNAYGGNGGENVYSY